MRIVLLLFLLIGSLSASEPVSTYPLWDGVESVADYAKRVNLPPTQTLELGDGAKLELVLIPAGKFVMGAPERERPLVGQTMIAITGGLLLFLAGASLIRARHNRKRPQFTMRLMLLMTFVAAIGVWGGVRWKEALKHLDNFFAEHPAHAVTLTQPFYMGKYDVTQEQYRAVTGMNPSKFIGNDNPVENVLWDDAQAFCKKVTDQIKDGVRLPTEAEWEYACRAGTTTEFFSGDLDSDLERVAWCAANSRRIAHPVGQKEPNKFGLYDMHGNVWQWCQDLWDVYYYKKSPIENPQGLARPSLGAYRILRGGGCEDDPMYCRSAFRDGDDPANRVGNVGFRVVVTVHAFRILKF